MITPLLTEGDLDRGQPPDLKSPHWRCGIVDPATGVVCIRWPHRDDEIVSWTGGPSARWSLTDRGHHATLAQQPGGDAGRLFTAWAADTAVWPGPFYHSCLDSVPSVSCMIHEQGVHQFKHLQNTIP